MASAPRWKVYSAGGEYRASCKHLDDAAALVVKLGHGATIRDGHKAVVWAQGVTGDAGESYDAVFEAAEYAAAVIARSQSGGK